MRGAGLRLPAGQDVARAMGIEPLSKHHLLSTADDSGVTRELEFDPALLSLLEIGRDEVVEELELTTPLWFYVLKEAEVEAGGEHLGPVGGRIVAEVLIGLLAGDPLSFLSVEPRWTPTFGPDKGSFTLTDLVTFATGRRSEPPAGTATKGAPVTGSERDERERSIGPREMLRRSREARERTDGQRVV